MGQNLELRQAEITDLVKNDDGEWELTTRLKTKYTAKAVIIATGTYLGGVIFVGDVSYESGPDGIFPSKFLPDALKNMGMSIRRFKTGTPARVLKSSIDFTDLEEQAGDEPVIPFSYDTLEPGENKVLCHISWTNEKGEKVKEAGPSFPVEITGLDDVPSGGDIFNAVSDERLARELVEQRKEKQKEEQWGNQTKVTLDNLFDQMQLGEVKELKVIVKADVQGSVEAVRQSLEKLSNDEVRVNVIHGGVGAIRESDVMLASASNAIIVGFNVRPDPVAAENAERDGVDMRLYRVIYDCIEEIQSAMKGMLAPKVREVELGRVECRTTYKITNVGIVAGSYVLSGKAVRGADVRVVRDGIVIADDKIASLQRFKDSVKEVAAGFECGITLERFSDLKDGDIFEVYEMQEYTE